MEKEQTLQQRIKSGKIRREDVARRLAELAFGKVNDCVRLVLEDDPAVEKLDLGQLCEIKRNEKGTVEIKLVDRLRALEQLCQLAEQEGTDVESFPIPNTAARRVSRLQASISQPPMYQPTSTALACASAADTQ